MKNFYVKIIMVLTMIIAFGVQGYAQRHHHHHRPIYRPHYGYYTPYIGATAVYTTDAYGITRRTYVAPVVVERSPYSTRTTTSATPKVKEEKAPFFEQDGVYAERISQNRVKYKGPKVKGILDTTKNNKTTVPTKKGQVVIEMVEEDVRITVYHGDKVVNIQEL